MLSRKPLIASGFLFLPRSFRNDCKGEPQLVVLVASLHQTVIANALLSFSSGVKHLQLVAANPLGDLTNLYYFSFIVLSHYINKPRFKSYLPYLLVFLIVALITAQSILLGQNNFWGGNHTHYNNYLIFKQSFKHLFQNTNLYSFYPEEYGDLYKYSPSFAVFMAPFYYLPDFAGLFLWNALNCVLLFYSVLVIKKIPSDRLLYFFLFTASELIVSTQNAQSNALIAALLILSFDSFEKASPGAAALYLVLGAFVKIFTLAGCLLFLLYPQKLKFILYCLLYTVMIGLLPLLFVSFHDLLQQYQNWKIMLGNDHSTSQGYSIYQVLSDITGRSFSKITILLLGLVILVLPLTAIKKYTDKNFRFLYLCLLLIWLVIFNHKAESPSYIIAMIGCGLWAFYDRLPVKKISLVILTWIFVSAFKIDIFPPKLRSEYHTDSLMAIMPAIILLVILITMLLRKGRNHDIAGPDNSVNPQIPFAK